MFDFFANEDPLWSPHELASSKDDGLFCIPDNTASTIKDFIKDNIVIQNNLDAAAPVIHGRRVLSHIQGFPG